MQSLLAAEITLSIGEMSETFRAGRSGQHAADLFVLALSLPQACPLPRAAYVSDSSIAVPSGLPFRSMLVEA